VPLSVVNTGEDPVNSVAAILTDGNASGYVHLSAPGVDVSKSAAAIPVPGIPEFARQMGYTDLGNGSWLIDGTPHNSDNLLTLYNRYIKNLFPTGILPDSRRNSP